LVHEKFLAFLDDNSDGWSLRIGRSPEPTASRTSDRTGLVAASRKSCASNRAVIAHNTWAVGAAVTDKPKSAISGNCVL
jgi:hypothetical protein